MIITCPSCDAQYILPDGAISPTGRKLKCTTCDYVWTQRPEDQAGIPDDALNQFLQETQLPAMETPLPRAGATPVRKDSSFHAQIVKGVVAGLAALVITLLFLIMFRDNFTRSWPAMALFYEKIGLPVAIPGKDLDLRDVTAVLDPSAKPNAIVLKGVIGNGGKNTVTLPDLMVTANGAEGWLKEWPLDLGNTAMKPGGSAPFQFKLTGVPAGVTDVTVRFY